jgi:phospholipase/carboxylesterase
MLPPKSGGAPRQIMVLLHGYGADGSDLIGLGREWRDLWPDMLFVSPNAPRVCEQNPGGFEWFPLQVDRIAGRIAGAELARPAIVEFLEDIWTQTGLTASDTVLAGFSQGAMMALNVGTSLEARLAAIVAFSGALIEPAGTNPAVRPPVALIHGEFDQVVEPRLSRDAATQLGGQGFDVALHISPGIGHGIAADGLEFATAFLVRALAAQA